MFLDQIELPSTVVVAVNLIKNKEVKSLIFKSFKCVKDLSNKHIFFPIDFMPLSLLQIINQFVNKTTKEIVL